MPEFVRRETGDARVRRGVVEHARRAFLLLIASLRRGEEQVVGELADEG